MQTARDWYNQTTSDIGMHAELVELWMRTITLLMLPIAPHFSEHVWSTVLGEPRSVQWALWPEVPARAVDESVLAAGLYMRQTLKTIRDAEIALAKKGAKGAKGAAKGGAANAVVPYDARKPKALRVVVATGFPEWQNVVVQVVKEAYVNEVVDDALVREALTKKGLMKDKRIMPFVQSVKVRPSSRSFSFHTVLSVSFGWISDGLPNLERQWHSNGRFLSTRRRLWRR